MLCEWFWAKQKLYCAEFSKIVSRPLSEFIPGQRWISNTESNLGLGVVVDVANRRVVMSFPAVQEERTYAIDNAPLSRVIYPVGEQVKSYQGLEIVISEVIEEDGGVYYLGFDAEGEDHSIDELELDSSVHFSKPHDRLFAGQVEKNNRFQLRLETLKHQHQHVKSPGFGLIGPRVQLLPHQMFIAHQVGERFAPRVLLADEVGLGKTIEAGLVLHQQLTSGKSSRALIVVPDSLIHQWLVEMLRRFNLRFTILDELRCTALEMSDEGVNPFETAQLVLCTLPFLTNSTQRQAQAIMAGWDMLIVDEAHHLEWAEDAISTEYACIEALSAEIKGLLLLTATPEQLGMEGHFARLRLLDPDRYYDLAKFREEEASYQPVRKLMEALLADDVLEQIQDAAVQASLAEYLGQARIDALLDAAQNLEDFVAFDELLQTTISELLDHHGTGRVLFRNTRDAVEGFPERILHQYPLPEPDFYLESEKQLLDGADLDLLLHPEKVFQDRWLEADPRVEWLVEWLAANRDEKTLVICAAASTAKQLEEHLRLYEGVRSAVFHEGMSLVNRDRAAAYFADEDDSAQVLICSEIGSEGRNFQFASNLVLFDLPLNPDLLEQRIGRLDRIGQKNDVNLHVPYFTEAQGHLLAWYEQGLNCFATACPAGSALFERFETPLLTMLRGHANDDEAEKLISETRAAADETMAALQAGRNKLLEMNSCDPLRAAELIENIDNASASSKLSKFMEKVFDQFGVEQQHHSTNSIVLHPSDHMHCESFPGLPEEGMTATFNRTTALSREDMHFLSWEHPMVAGAMDMILSGEFGNAAVCSIKLPPLKPGTLLLESIFTLHCAAPKHLQVQRYLPETLVRIVVDVNKTDLSKVLTEQHINNLAERVGKRQAVDIVKHTRTEINAMVAEAEELAEKQQPAIYAAAQENVSHVLGAEIERMVALAEINPNIRAEEIAALVERQELLEGYLETLQLKLDAIRVIVAT